MYAGSGKVESTRRTTDPTSQLTARDVHLIVLSSNLLQERSKRQERLHVIAVTILSAVILTILGGIVIRATWTIW